MRFSFAVPIVLTIVSFFPQSMKAGGPRYVAGTSYFNPSAKGTPVTWVQGTVHYSTDQGDLSPLLPGAAADAFVADAFLRWTSVPTAAVAAVRDGQLAEDVSSANVLALGDGSFSLPADILDSATDKPLAIVYDSDGQVLEALVGEGASSSCFDNAVVERGLTFDPDAHFTHALLILNGRCATTTTQLADMKYQLVRALGRILGLGWSQTKPNPAIGDLGGFALMHEKDSATCVPISRCYGATADQLKVDDRAALSRLYPVTTENLPNFPGKRLFFENAFRIHGSVRFVDANGRPGLPMQGVNVVARWYDPVAKAISTTFVASSVSGFKFRGNAGNPVTGFVDALEERFDQFGSDDVSLEGLYDLTGIEAGQVGPSQEFQISVEPVDPTWSPHVGPYGRFPVWPSGSSNLLTVRPSRGQDLVLDILMQASAPQVDDWFGSQSFTAPANLPAGGDWTGSLSTYGMVHYFRLHGKAGRTLAVELTAQNEKGEVSQSKAMPVAGIWTMRDSQLPAEEATPFAFNTGSFGFTRLDEVSLSEDTDYRIGIADYRGDGRPDFRYHARVLYGDQVIPARASAGGNTPLIIRGMGFRSNTAVHLGAASLPILGMTAGAIVTRAAAQLDGVQDIALLDPVTGSSSIMSDAITFGAGPNDRLLPVSLTNPPVAVGSDAPNAIRVRVMAPDGVTPVSGASVAFQSVPAASLSACQGADGCTVLTDQSGEASTRAALKTRAPVTIRAQLAPLSYSPPKQVSATLAPNAPASLDITLDSETVWAAQGATVDVSLGVHAISTGVPQPGKSLNILVEQGTPGLSASGVTTDATGRATIYVHTDNLVEEVHVLACAAPGNAPCSHTFRIIPVALSSLQLQPVSGNLQLTFGTQPFLPIVIRVTDSSVAANPVTGAKVVLQVLTTQPQEDAPPVTIGDTSIRPHPVPIILGSYQIESTSDPNGLALFQMPPSEFPDAAIQGTAFTGSATLQLQLRVLPPVAAQVSPERVTVFTKKTSPKVFLWQRMKGRGVGSVGASRQSHK